MKRMLSGMTGGAALLLLLTGCDPELAQIPAGSQEELWYRHLKDSYFSFAPPQTPAPAAYNRQAAPAPAARNAEKPADDPENAVDRAADGENAAAQNASRESGKEQAEAKSAEAKSAEAKSADGKSADGKSADGKSADGKSADGKSADGKFADGKSADGKSADGKSAEAAPAADAPAGKPYIVKSGDTLGGIAKQFYGKSSLDDVIFRANTKVIKDRNKLVPGMRLVIPEL